MNESRPRLAVVSPFVDTHYGTERYVAEWISRLTDHFEIHLYSQRVEGVDLSHIRWHKISQFPGPHIFNYAWWFVCNQLHRRWDARFRGLHCELIFSPGINCFDADAISVHIIFGEILRRHSAEMRFRTRSIREWPRLLHRNVYYKLIRKLERRIYTKPHVDLIAMSRRISDGLQEFYGRRNPSQVVHFGLDQDIFNPARRLELRSAARDELDVKLNEFVLLLIGNDWLNKGLPVLLEVMSRLRDLPLRLLVVGQDDRAPYVKSIEERSLTKRIDFLPPRKDVESYYAAADVYTGPSREDALPLPPAEAMACGLPVIVTAKCGISEIITDGQDGLIMQDPTNADDLAAKIRSLCSDSDMRTRIGRSAAEAMRQFTWERSAQEFGQLLSQALRKKNAGADTPHGDA